MFLEAVASSLISKTAKVALKFISCYRMLKAVMLWAIPSVRAPLVCTTRWKQAGQPQFWQNVGKSSSEEADGHTTLWG